MSHYLTAIATFLMVMNFGLAQETPASGGSTRASSSSGTYSGLVETTYDDPNWVLAISDIILRENLCEFPWYEKVFEPCIFYNDKPQYVRYWKLESCSEPGQVFPMSAFGDVDLGPIYEGTLDSIFIRDGVQFQLYVQDPYDPNAWVPYDSAIIGPQYVNLTFWRDVNPAPNGFEPGTIFVEGDQGDLKDYAIVIQPTPLLISKVDDVNDANCVYPGDFITYQICYENHSDANSLCYQDANNVIITDILPVGVNFVSASHNGVYEPNTRKVTWSDIGNLSPGDSNCLQLIVEVNESAQAGGSLINYCEIISDISSVPVIAIEDTNVCCWADILYVDEYANGYNNGTSWANAYNDIQDALDTVKSCDCYTSIWVADGNYYPTLDANQTDATFVMLDGVALIGHFAGVEDDPDERNLADASNTSTLQGKIGSTQSEAVQYVVTFDDVNDAGYNTVIDGFTITGSYGGAGMLIKDSNASVLNCVFRDNDPCGIYIKGSLADIFNCTFTNNYQGIAGSKATISVSNSTFENKSGLTFVDSKLTIDRCRIENSNSSGLIMYKSYSWLPGCELMLSNSIFCDNPQDGISLTDNKKTEIGNCWIYNNGTSGNGSGISMDGDKSFPYIFNNTIYKNKNYGIYNSLSDGDPNIISCIIRDNTSGGLDGSFGDIKYCCLQEPNDSIGNKVCDPCFYNPDSYDLHLKSDSPCKNAGYPSGSYLPDDGNHLVLIDDIDGEPRVVDNIDIGADEYYWSPADYDYSEEVNLVDLAMFAAAWLIIDSTIALDGTNFINFSDYAYFGNEWMWYAAWGQDPPVGKMCAGNNKIFSPLIFTRRSFNEGEYQGVDAAKKIPEFNVDELLDWWDELWQSGDLEDWTYDDYLDFRDAIEKSNDF